VILRPAERSTFILIQRISGPKVSGMFSRELLSCYVDRRSDLLRICSAFLKLVASVSFVPGEDSKVTHIGLHPGRATWVKDSAIPKLLRDCVTVGKVATDETERRQMKRTAVFIQERYAC
jgi:hypothetical protein